MEPRCEGTSPQARIAQRFRQETTMTVGWIAERLRMGACPHSTHLLYWAERGQ